MIISYDGNEIFYAGRNHNSESNIIFLADGTYK